MQSFLSSQVHRLHLHLGFWQLIVQFGLFIFLLPRAAKRDDWTAPQSLTGNWSHYLADKYLADPVSIGITVTSHYLAGRSYIV